MLFESYPSRRSFLASAGLLGCSTSGWLRTLAAAEEGPAKPPRSCILLWMAGGPSQTDTFDMKPGHAHGGAFKPIDSSLPGVQISEHLPEVSKQMHRLAVIRSMSTREGDHGRATEHLRTGYLPQGPIQFPVLGSVVSNEYANQPSDLPRYVSVLPRGLFRAGQPPAGFLGPDHAPLIVGGEADAEGLTRLQVENLALPRGVAAVQAASRRQLLDRLERDFLEQHPGASVESHRSAYGRSLKLMTPQAAKAFSLDEESGATRERYGSTQFAQGCLLARRLVERGVPFVEVSLGGWDTHYENFSAVERLSQTLDRPWAALLDDLEERGLLESTLVVWMGEFGRTPGINPQQGRDHYPKAWSVVLGGGGIRGGQAHGRTGDDGLSVEDHPVSTPDLMATICTAMGLDPRKQNISNVARPIRLVDPEGKAITELLG